MVLKRTVVLKRTRKLALEIHPILKIKQGVYYMYMYLKYVIIYFCPNLLQAVIKNIHDKEVTVGFENK